MNKKAKIIVDAAYHVHKKKGAWAFGRGNEL
jgi:hypothetical protein